MKVKLLEIPFGVRYREFKEGDIVEGTIDNRSGYAIFTAPTLHYWMPDEYEIIEEDDNK